MGIDWGSYYGEKSPEEIEKEEEEAYYRPFSDEYRPYKKNPNDKYFFDITCAHGITSIAKKLIERCFVKDEDGRLLELHGPEIYGLSDYGDTYFAYAKVRKIYYMIRFAKTVEYKEKDTVHYKYVPLRICKFTKSQITDILNYMVESPFQKSSLIKLDKLTNPQLMSILNYIMKSPFKFNGFEGGSLKSFIERGKSSNIYERKTEDDLDCFDFKKLIEESNRQERKKERRIHLNSLIHCAKHCSNVGKRIKNIRKQNYYNIVLYYLLEIYPEYTLEEVERMVAKEITDNTLTGCKELAERFVKDAHPEIKHINRKKQVIIDIQEICEL